jgi:CoA:oxalate CoA-transferase
VTGHAPAEQVHAGPLDGVRVVDFTELLPGPFLSQSLVDLGAQVIKIERPPYGDNARRLVPGVFEALNRGKQSLFLDLKNDAQRAQAQALIAGADIVLEGFRPGVMQRLGLGYEAVRVGNDRLIYVSLTGYGQTGPLAMLAGHDINYLAAAGVSALSGRLRGAPEHTYGLPVADLAGALYGLVSVLAALQQRQRTSRGQWLDVSVTDCLLHMMNPRLGQFAVSGQVHLEEQRREVLLRPGYGIFDTADGAHVSIAAIEDHFWSRLVVAIGLRVDDLDIGSFAARSSCAEILNSRIQERVAQLPSNSLCDALQAADVPHFRVLLPGELATHPQHQARGTLFCHDAKLGPMTLSHFPVDFDLS